MEKSQQHLTGICCILCFFPFGLLDHDTRVGPGLSGLLTLHENVDAEELVNDDVGVSALSVSPVVVVVVTKTSRGCFGDIKSFSSANFFGTLTLLLNDPEVARFQPLDEEPRRLFSDAELGFRNTFALVFGEDILASMITTHVLIFFSNALLLNKSAPISHQKLGGRSNCFFS